MAKLKKKFGLGPLYLLKLIIHSTPFILGNINATFNLLLQFCTKKVISMPEIWSINLHSIFQATGH